MQSYHTMWSLYLWICDTLTYLFLTKISRDWVNTNNKPMSYFLLWFFFTYSNHIWGSTYKSRLKWLIALQNKIIAYDRWRVSCDSIYKKLNMIKLENISTNLFGRFMHCIFIHPPESFRSLFIKRIVNTGLTELDLPNNTISHRWNLKNWNKIQRSNYLKPDNSDRNQLECVWSCFKNVQSD